MIDIMNVIAVELAIKSWQVQNTISLKTEGATIPFIARYRKEKTGELNENQIRDIFDKFDYLTELEERKVTILKTIEEQGKLTDELKEKILNCLVKNELEDLYLPYKPKKRTRATIAREKGLGELADLIKNHNQKDAPYLDLESAGEKFVNTEMGVESVADALKGASDIIAEEIAETAELRAWTREFMFNNGSFKSTVKDEFEAGTTKYEMYRQFSAQVKDINPHNMLALRRGEKENIVVLDLDFDEQAVIDYLKMKTIFSPQNNIIDYYTDVVKDGFQRLMKHSLIAEVRLECKTRADLASIIVFESNMRQLLLAAPAGLKPTMGIDPGFRTGCKVAVVDETGKFLEYKTIFPFKSDMEKYDAADTIKKMIERHNVELIAIGNGTAGRETDEFVTDVMKSIKQSIVRVMVSEAGASVYSASEVANEEFPELDLTVRGAISIARRLQDPLAELVKIDPKSIGVGQYQHDVDQKLLKKKLEETVESSVNYVGVDLNTASKELLTHVSGINITLAKSIVDWRNQNGAFRNRKQLMDVKKFGPKAFEQAAGFLRIRKGENVLDNTAVHPESYSIVERFSKDLNLQLTDIIQLPKSLEKLNLSNYINDKIGLPTLKDIVAELEKPGRDPREVFKYATFMDGVKTMDDLREGMQMEGVVTNITKFGAFVDIGVHQDGLVHVSEMADKYVSDPTEIVKVGMIVNVTVKEVNIKLKRISLSMKKGAKKSQPVTKSSFNLDDLKTRFTN